MQFSFPYCLHSLVYQAPGTVTEAKGFKLNDLIDNIKIKSHDMTVHYSF